VAASRSGFSRSSKLIKVLALFLRLPLLFACFVQLKYSSASSLFSGTIALSALFLVSPAVWELEQEQIFYLFI